MSIIGETVLQFRYSNLAARTVPSGVDYKVSERRFVSQGVFEKITEASDRLKLLLHKSGYACIFADGVLPSPSDPIEDEAKLVASDFKVVVNYLVKKRKSPDADAIVLADLTDITDRCITPIRNNFIVNSVSAEATTGGYIITVG